MSDIVIYVTFITFVVFVFATLVSMACDKERLSVVFFTCFVMIAALLLVELLYSMIQDTVSKRSLIYNEGHHWEYQQAVGHQYSTAYIYKCTDCGKVIETDKLIDEVN